MLLSPVLEVIPEDYGLNALKGGVGIRVSGNSGKHHQWRFNIKDYYKIALYYNCR